MSSQPNGRMPRERRALPETITAGGVTRWLTKHLRENPHPGVTADRIQYALENWVARGVCTNSEGSTTMTYWGFVPGRRAMLRVPVSLDDAEIITATFDSEPPEGSIKRVAPGFNATARTWRCEMEVKYYPEDDVLILIASPNGGGGGTLRDDFGVIFVIDGEDDGDQNVTRVDVHDATRLLPLDAERGYDALTDTLTMGDKPTADCRVVDNGDFVSYRQWFDDGSGWDVVAVDVRQASVHLAPVVAALSAAAPVGSG